MWFGHRSRTSWLLKTCCSITIIGEYCIDRTAPWRHLGTPVRTDACPWPEDEDGADMPKQDAFDASAWHSWRPFCAPFSTSSSDFGTRS